MTSGSVDGNLPGRRLTTCTKAKHGDLWLGTYERRCRARARTNRAERVHAAINGGPFGTGGELTSVVFAELAGMELRRQEAPTSEPSAIGISVS